jgi:hypothetical protein
MVMLAGSITALGLLRPMFMALIACVPATLLMYGACQIILSLEYSPFIVLVLGGMVCLSAIAGCLFAVDYQCLTELRQKLLSGRLGGTMS